MYFDIEHLCVVNPNPFYRVQSRHTDFNNSKTNKQNNNKTVVFQRAQTREGYVFKAEPLLRKVESYLSSPLEFPTRHTHDLSCFSGCCVCAPTSYPSLVGEEDHSPARGRENTTCAVESAAGCPKSLRGRGPKRFTMVYSKQLIIKTNVKPCSC